MITLRTTSPAKLNLGLEITGRRADGYHNLISVFQSITLADDLEFTAPVPRTMLLVQHQEGGGTDITSDNLITRAIDLFSARFAPPLATRVTLTKRIPVASGFGGASSNAAATLRAVRALSESELSRSVMMALARELGSDIPFFLTAGTALVSGTGDQIDPLPSPGDGWFVLMSPRLGVPIERKTATLYQALTERDFSSGGLVRAQAENLVAGRRLDPSLLTNPFQRHMLELRPELALLLDAFTAAGAPFVALSGAGPGHYTYVEHHEAAERIASRARSRIGGHADIFVATVCPYLAPLEKIASVA
ncbi:MAG: 4-(cytidine 5'-diphospho)-2-C-methyl-D-erythritol kinase [Thermomicrobiales bacterium]